MLAQRSVEGKSNEITAIPRLLDRLALDVAIVSIGAMRFQAAVAAKIVAAGGDYGLAPKGNQTSLHENAWQTLSKVVAATISSQVEAVTTTCTPGLAQTPLLSVRPLRPIMTGFLVLTQPMTRSSSTRPSSRS